MLRLISTPQDPLTILESIITTAFAIYHDIQDPRLEVLLTQLDMLRHQLNTRPSSRSSLASISSTDALFEHNVLETLHTLVWKPAQDNWRSDPFPYHYNHFKKWVLSSAELPEPGSKLNCWEAVFVILHKCGALTKEAIKEAYENRARPGECPPTDPQVALTLLGLYPQNSFGNTHGQIDIREEVSWQKDLQPGDILCLDCHGHYAAHIVLVINTEALRPYTISFWQAINRHYKPLIKITPDKLITCVSKDSTLPDVTHVRISTKFRPAFQVSPSQHSQTD